MTDDRSKRRRPRLATGDIPQADDLPRVRRVLEALVASGRAAEPGPGDTAALAAATGVAARHVSYALAAARVLGWLDAGFALTPAGQSLLATLAGSPDEHRLLVEAVVGCPVLETLGVDLLGPVEPRASELCALIQRASELSESTAMRRATSLLAWRRQLLERPAPRGATVETTAPRLPAVVYRGGPVLTMTDGAGPGAVAEALAVREGRILAVGTLAEVQEQAGDDARIVELEGRALLPGFIDPHHHLGIAALYAGAVDVSPSATGTVTEVLARLQQAASTLPPGEWVIGTGLDPLHQHDRRAPLRTELDAACPEHPVLLIHHTFHEAFASTRALEAAGIARHTPDPSAGTIVRGARGEPTGHLIETALGPVEALARQALLRRDAEGLAARLEAAQTRLFAMGLVRVSDPTVPPEMEKAFRELHAAGHLRISLDMLPVGNAYLCPPWDRLELKDGSVTLSGTEELRMGPMKLIFDGGQSCAICGTLGQLLRMSVAALVEAARHRTLDPLRAAAAMPMRIDLSGRFHAGLLYHRDDSTALLLAGAAVDRGFGLAVHALGNEAVAQAARVLEKLRDRHPAQMAPRIEHALVIDDALLATLPRAGLMVVTQPGFLGLVSRRVAPPLPGLQLCPLKSLLQAGVAVAASSDAPVISPDPLLGVRAACQRLSGDGEVIEPGEAIDVMTALSLYTREAARAAGCLDFAGTLSAGKRADLVVLSDDPRRLAAGVGRLEELRVMETVLGGETVFSGTQ
jgi:predicted amidohydrolase YtcJ